eukprot:TRINITY_DN12562_c0_g1_i1.p1 TRINITY_DN12562_c0_g1~~TRINITY_DN12562_c0_g1_i1.p1  ORF type:complete len:276 (-),score=93.32 TRINITY_DN12562_c0_g1_i1:125-856(-)
MASKPSAFAKAYVPKSKLVVSFDEKSRKDFVTGFRKRKNERRKKADKEQKEALRKERVAARKEETKAIDKKVEERMRRMDGLDSESGEEEEFESELQYKPKEDILITTTISPLLYDDHLKPLVFKRRRQTKDGSEEDEEGSEKEEESESSESESEEEQPKHKHDTNKHNNNKKSKKQKQEEDLSFPTIEYEVSEEDIPRAEKEDENDNENDNKQHRRRKKRSGYSLLESVERMNYDKEGNKIV